MSFRPKPVLHHMTVKEFVALDRPEQTTMTETQMKTALEKLGYSVFKK